MDRTSWIGVLVCLALLFGWGWWNAKEAAKRADELRKNPPVATPSENTGEDIVKADPSTSDPASTTPTEEPVEEKTTFLETEALSLELTTRGAGISVARLKDHKRKIDEGSELIAINETASHGIGVISRGPGKFDTANWNLASSTPTSVTFTTKTPEGFQLSKTFRLSEEASDPYQVTMDLQVANGSETPLILENRYLYAGSAAPLHLNEWSMQIGMFWFEGTGDFEYKTVDHYGGKKVLGIFGKSEIPSDRFTLPILDWAGVNDQFFTTIIAPREPHEAEIWGSRFPIVVEGDEAASVKRRMFAAEAGVGLPGFTLNPGDSRTLTYDLYLGPKEFSRLRALGEHKERVMHYDEIPIFGWLFGWAIKPLASWLIMGLVFLEGKIGNFGLAIILITILIRLLIWPVYAKSARSMKRMSKLTPMMKDLKEKYGDDPQKLNEETMKLYRTYNINPLGGCLPMFIQLPVFLAFYRMLWSAVELRHESFLWVDDLAMPDTMFMIPGLGIPFNLLPILMGLTSFIQIAITPKTGDKTQQMIFMLMPVIFLVICYNFAAALSLYWTTSNAFSILQTWLMNKMPEPELKKRASSGKKSFMQRMQEQAEAAQKAKASGGGVTSRDRTRMPGEKGDRHTKGKKKRR